MIMCVAKREVHWKQKQIRAGNKNGSTEVLAEKGYLCKLVNTNELLHVKNLEWCLVW